MDDELMIWDMILVKDLLFHVWYYHSTNINVLKMLKIELDLIIITNLSFELIHEYVGVWSWLVGLGLLIGQFFVFKTEASVSFPLDSDF